MRELGTDWGSDTRLESAFRAHHAGLVRLGTVLTGDPALGEDLAQEAFVRLGRSTQWPAPGTELAYLRRTVVNLSHGHHRRLAIGRRQQALPDQPFGDCVVLRYYADLSQEEIAVALDVSAGSVKTHLHRARAALTESLEHLR